jgi:hypothetical protein
LHDHDDVPDLVDAGNVRSRRAVRSRCLSDGRASDRDEDERYADDEERTRAAAGRKAGSFVRAPLHVRDDRRRRTVVGSTFRTIGRPSPTG